jgi:hypothetical protein
MDVLALILACSLHSDDALVRVLVDVQSGGNIYFVGDLTTLKTSDNLTSADEALRVAADIERHGGRPAVGLLGVPLEWAARFGRSPRDLFDGCANLEVGSAMLSEFQDACPPHPPRDRRVKASSRRHVLGSHRRVTGAGARTCVLTRLAGELGLHGTPAEILKRVGVTSTQTGADAPPQTSAIFGDGADDADAAPADWSNPRVYLDARVAVAAVKEPAPSAMPSRRSPSSPAPGQLAPLAPSPAERALPPIRRISP